MKKSTGAITGGVCLGAAIAYGVRWYLGLRRIRTVHLTNNDLHYSNLSPEELVAQHLIDLNGASAEQMALLGLAVESMERLFENRPYRSKLELVSRMILSQDEYSAIKDKVSVSEGGESVKIA
jgi:hypothetical protein